MNEAMNLPACCLYFCVSVSGTLLKTLRRNLDENLFYFDVELFSRRSGGAAFVS